MHHSSDLSRFGGFNGRAVRWPIGRRVIHNVIGARSAIETDIKSGGKRKVRERYIEHDKNSKRKK